MKWSPLREEAKEIEATDEDKQQAGGQTMIIGEPSQAESESGGSKAQSILLHTEQQEITVYSVRGLREMVHNPKKGGA